MCIRDRPSFTPFREPLASNHRLNPKHTHASRLSYGTPVCRVKATETLQRLNGFGSPPTTRCPFMLTAQEGLVVVATKCQPPQSPSTTPGDSTRILSGRHDEPRPGTLPTGPTDRLPFFPITDIHSNGVQQRTGSQDISQWGCGDQP